MDRTAVITGGTGGLGAAVTAAFLEAGHRVVVPWYAESELDRVDRRERLELVQADLTDPASVAEVARVAGPSVRSVVNLVGGFAAPGRVHEVDIEAFESQLRLNLRPTYLVCHAALPALLDAGEGSIVCVSSRAALRPFPGAAGYVTAKAGVRAFVGALHAEYGEAGIRANAVEPDLIDTPVNRREMPGAVDRMVAPGEIARTILALCDPAVTGATAGAVIPVYGRA